MCRGSKGRDEMLACLLVHLFLALSHFLHNCYVPCLEPWVTVLELRQTYCVQH